MSDVAVTVHEGLEGVLVTRTRLSHVDGERGRLIVAGHDVEDWAARFDFEQASQRLWAAAGLDAAGLSERLDVARARAFETLPQLGDALRREDAMDALRAGLAHWPEHTRPEELVAAAAVYTAAHARLRSGCEPIAPCRGQRHAQALLGMLGLADDADRSRALDAYLVGVIDHGLNASTFAARVVASAHSDLVSAVVAAVGALKGPLHGGAPGPVLDMLDAIGEPERARGYLQAELTAGRRIMGMGHRIYRQRDPRALVLERALTQLEAALRARGDESGRTQKRLELARAVEQEAARLLAERHPERPLQANVEFYTAVLLSALGIDPALFSAVFACARSVGWIAHFTEQRKHGRLIRPSALYIGTTPG